jgi:benzoyl-CoA-dihydrodiol lyase
MDDAISFETHPSRYRHIQLTVDGAVARIGLQVAEAGGLRPGYALKLNSYDLGVDIELADALQRIRFEHPSVRCVVVTSLRDRVFCAGANIQMLGLSSHAFKVNFCKFTNETRLAIEEASAESGIKFLAALNGTCAGGGYELALACDEIVLVDDGSSAVSLPEVPLLAVLPGTGGLTRVVDKRKVRRDLADLFATLAEGVRGQRAVDWRLIDAAVPRSRFDAEIRARADALAAKAPAREGAGVALPPLAPAVNGRHRRYSNVSLDIDGRVATLTVLGPKGAPSRSPADLRALGADAWALRMFRELDDALLHLRVNEPEVGVVVVRSRGEIALVREHDAAVVACSGSDWFAREIVLQMRRALKRLDLTAKSTFALVDAGSCFAGSLLEVALACDRTYMLADEAERVAVDVSPLNAGALCMANGLSRLQTRFLHAPEHARALLAYKGPITTGRAMKAGLVTAAPDEIDWDDEVRIAIEERASLSPDALTGLEANLRFAGPETMETKIFGRLSAWQNWIFQRPNAVGEKGALTLYGKPERASFDWRRT